MKENTTLRNITAWMAKILFWISTSLAVLLVVILIGLQTPFVQNYLAKQLIDFVNKNTRETAKLSNIKIKWFDLIEIKGLELRDYANNRMIYADYLSVNYSLFDLINDGNIHIDEVYLRDAELGLVNYKDTLGINILEFVYDLSALSAGSTDTTGASPKFEIVKIRLDEMSFWFDNKPSDSLPSGKFDYSHFKLDIPGGTFSNFLIWADTVRTDVKYFAARDSKTGLTVNELKCLFELNSRSMSFSNLDLKTPKSIIKDEAVFYYNSVSDLAEFTSKVDLYINLDDAIISKNDLSYFVDIPSKNFSSEISAVISGSIPRLSVEQVRMNLGKGSALVGDFDFMGLPNVNETFIDARIKHAAVDPLDIALFTTNNIEYIKRLGKIRFDGRFLGFVNDFVANGAFKTNIGRINSDINLKFPEGWEKAKYSGKLQMQRFNVGKLIGRPKDVGTINMFGKIDGSGLTQENAIFNLNADFTNSSFLGYRFHEIKAAGKFASEYFNGFLAVMDPNCEFSIEGNLDLNKSIEEIQLEAQIDYVDLFELHLMDEPLSFSTTISSNILDTNIDSIQGGIQLRDLNINWRERSLRLDSISAETSLADGLRKISVGLPDVRMSVQGNFGLNQVLNDFQMLQKDLEAYFNFKTLKKAYTSGIENKYSIDFELEYDDITKYTKLLMGDVLYVSPSGKIEGTYYQRKNATLSLFTEIDSINYDGVSFSENTLDINLSKDLDSMGIIAYAYLNSEKQKWKGDAPTQDLALEAVWFDRKINFNTQINQPANKSSANINGEMRLNNDQSVFRFLPSKVIAFGEQWFFNPYNKLTYSEKNILIDRMELYQSEQSISLKGVYSDSSKTNLNLAIANLDINTLQLLIPFDIGGHINANIDLTRENYENPYLLGSYIDIKKLAVDDFEIGDVQGSSEWNQVLDGLGINLTVQREAVKTVDINGFYFPGDEHALDINAVFDQASLKLLEPFFVGLFSNIKGNASGKVHLSGSPSFPVLTGSSSVTNGNIKFDYLGTEYAFDGKISFDNGAINFDRLNLKDREQDGAILTGKISHSGFRDFGIDLKVICQHFLLLNTNMTENELYYGSANATGEISVSGPLTDLVIKAKAKTEKGTRIYIPLSESSEVTRKDYITFINLNDTSSAVDVEELVRKSISGIKLDFEIDVTPDAYVELIFDIKAGDIIRGRGNGNLKMILDTSGDFELFGDLTITEGAYNFTIPTFGINKEFKVVPGSTIAWYGDPYAGVLNLEATYRQIASFDSYDGSDNKQNYPFSVLLKLKGNMLSPDIKFQIKLDDNQSSALSSISYELDQMNNNDEQQLNKQVFSLLILRRFSPKDSYLAGNMTDVRGSISEFLTNQLSYFVSQMDENLEVDVDLTSLNDEAFNTLQLRLSYTFLDGRLRVSGAGAVTSNSNNTTNNSYNDYVGDWTIQYLLTPDGHLRVKAFSQTDQIANQQQRETGVSFQYIKSFDDFKELLTKTREEAILNKREEVQPEEEEDGSE